jgi:hypothetical protein
LVRTAALISTTERAGGVQFSVRVVPRAGRTEVAGIRGGALVVRIAAPAVENAANEALISYLSSLLRRPKRDIVLVAGGKRRDKRVAIAGLTLAQLDDVLSAILPA